MIEVVVGGQFGSEAKGHVAAILAAGVSEGSSAACVRVNGPNAGHTVVDQAGKHWAFRSVPVAAVVGPQMDLFIAAGSEIEVEVLKDEIERCEQAGYSVRHRLYIDAQATIITEAHKRLEHYGQMTERLGSTAKGIGAARADRIMRKAGIARDEEGLHELGIVCDTQKLLREMPITSRIIIEGTQGYGLGLHAGYYPFCTSADCRAVDFLAAAGLTWQRGTRSWVVLRTYPIRVAGNSGPMFEEMTWAMLGGESNGYIQPEQTTVTKKTRRVGNWDMELAREALAANGPSAQPVLTFVDYWDPWLAGSSSMEELIVSKAWPTILWIESELGCQFQLFTTGPDSHIWRI